MADRKMETGLWHARQRAVRVVAADTTLGKDDLGKVILMGANGVDITLPACTGLPGAQLEVIQTADYATAVCTLIQAAATEEFVGAMYGTTQGESAGTDSDFAETDGSNTTITFAAASLRGDRVRLISDGTVWYVEAFAQNTAAITFDD